MKRRAFRKVFLAVAGTGSKMEKAARVLKLTAFSLVLAASGGAAASEMLVLSDGVPDGLNLDGGEINSPQTQTGIVNLMEPLIYFAKGGTNDEGVQLLDFSRFEGRLAESWSYDEATLTLTLNLRRGVKGCNGATFNADDVVYTFARGKSVSGQVPVGWFAGSVSSIEGYTPAVFGDEGARKLGSEVTKIDDYTVKIRQSAPNKLLLPVLTIFSSLIFDKEIMEENAGPDDPWSHKYATTVNVPGFGPYCLESWAKNDRFTVSAFPEYYRGKASIDRVIYKKVPQSGNRALALRSGQAHLVEHLRPKEYDNLRSVSGVDVAGHVGNQNIELMMNFETPPFDNILVRKAIASAIPYKQIIRDTYFGHAKRWKGNIPSSFNAYHEPLTQYDYDLERAKKLLVEAGYPNGDGLDQFAGAFELSYASESEATLGPPAIMIRTALSQLGIKVNLNPIPQAQYTDRDGVKRDLPLGLVDNKHAIVPDAVFAMLLYFVAPSKGGLNNPVNFNDDLFYAIYEKALVEPDTERRNALAAEAQEMLMDKVAWLPIAEWKSQWAFSSSLKGITWHPDNVVRWYDLRFER